MTRGKQHRNPLLAAALLLGVLAAIGVWCGMERMETTGDTFGTVEPQRPNPALGPL